MKLKFLIGLILGILLLAGVIIVIFLLAIIPASRETQSTTTGTSATVMTSPILTSTPAKPTPSNPPTATVSPTPTAGTNVNFDLYVTSVVISGITSATVSGQLTNTGTTDAHNVQAQVEAIYQGSRLQINGKDIYTYAIGTVKAKEVKQIQVVLTFNTLEAVKILQSGATFNLMLNSVEKTQSWSYDYKP